MNREQHLLCKLAEECAEVAQMALKTAYFGQDEVYVDQNNRERLHAELHDVMAVIAMLNSEFNFDFTEPDLERITSKIAKVNKYADYSEKLGLLQPNIG